MVRTKRRVEDLVLFPCTLLVKPDGDNDTGVVVRVSERILFMQLDYLPRVGDVIFFDRNQAYHTMIGNQRYLFVRQEHILGWEKKKTAPDPQ
jgi:hypothetical protein